MRVVSIVVGVLLLLAGGTFLLQGINVLPGSFMSGQSIWAVIGFIMVLCGAAACYFGLRRNAVKA